MTDSKRVFFGSLVEFSSAGAEELIHEFCASLSDRNSAPFITYDKIHKIFSCEVDHTDSHLIEGFVAQFHAYVEFHHIKKSDDLVESSPRLRPVAGTTTQDEITEATLLTANLEANLDPMLDYAEETDDSNDETSSLGHAVTYWTPQDGDVNILTTGIAEQIANLTGCHLFAEPTERRVRLVNGDLKAALTKLQQLEPILSRTAKHHLESESKVDGNVAVTRSDKLGTLIKFAKLQYPHCGFHRIMVGTDTHKKLHQSFLSELRIWEEGECVKPPNLDLEGVSILDVPGPSRIFQDVRMPAFGDPARAQAQIRSNSESLPPANEQLQAGPSRFMGTRNALRVTEWTKAVDPEANPEMPPPEPLPEQDAPVRRRIVVEDSSDEDDEVPPPRRKEATVNVPPPAEPLSRASQETEALIRSNSSDERKIIESSPIRVQPKQVSKPFTSRNVFDLLGLDDDDEIEDYPDQRSDTRSIPHESPMKELNTDDAILVDIGSQVHTKSSEESKTNQKTVRIDERPQSPRHYHSTPSRMGRNDGMTGPVPPLPRPVSRGMSPPPRPYASGSREARGSGRRVTQQQPPHSSANQTQRSRLVDTSATQSADQILSPPPGFDYRTNFIRKPLSEAIMITTDAHVSTSMITPSPEPSDQTGSSSVPSAEATNSSRNPFGYSPQYSVPKRNIRFMQEEAANRLRGEMQRHKVTKGDQVDGANDEEMPPERIEILDESRSRKLHQIMNQQAGKGAKPAKNKGTGNSAKQETKKEKEERIKKAMSEAYGAPPPQARPKSDAPPEKMSTKKKALIKSNSEMAALHPEELQRNAFEDQVQRFRTELEPLFEDSRAYPGQVKFELQIGQAFVLRHDRVNEQMLYKLRDWYQLFDTANQSAASVMFTNLVTVNGLDIDRLLDLQLPGTTSDLWSKQKSVSSTIVYDFFCLDKSGAEFIITIDQSAKHCLGKTRATLGKVAIHCPGQVWDACAILSGSREWHDAPTDLTRDVAQFIDEIYIPDHPGKASVYYRLPVTNTFTIRHIEVKCTNTFDCLDPTKADFQLQVTEVKSLIHSSHPVDKKLFRSHDLSYQDMIEKGRLHYVASITHKGINKALLENGNLEVGELTSAERTGKALITTSISRQMIGLIGYVVECIDWLGAANTGTLKRLEEESQLYQRTINAGLPPQALTQVGRAMPLQTGTVIHTITGPSGPRTVIPGSNTITGASTVGGMNEPRFVPGVRAGTNADLYQQDGQLFYYGVGGAKIPVIPSEVPGLQELHMNVSREPLMPQDSASQIGGSSRIVRQGLGIAGPRGRNPHDNKPAGFW